MVGHDNVFVIGDTTNLPVSKTGSAAHFEAELLAENVASFVKTGAPGAITTATSIASSRPASIAPPIDLQLLQPSRAEAADSKSMHWFKVAYNQMYWTTVRGLL